MEDYSDIEEAFASTSVEVVMLVDQANKSDPEEIITYVIGFESFTAAMAWVEFNTETTDANILDWKILYGYPNEEDHD